MYRGRPPRKGRLRSSTAERGEMNREQSKADSPVVETDKDRLLLAALRFWERSHLSDE